MSAKAGWFAAVLLAAGSSLAATTNLTPTSTTSTGAFSTQTFNGRTVWVPTNSSNLLYFNVPSTFSFTNGKPTYVRIEYHDLGWGSLLAEYDSNLGDNNRDSEIHSRSSRTGSDNFVYSYQLFQSCEFAGGQTGGNDFRFQLRGTDGTPLRIASVQISTTPYDDADFQYALSKPWLLPNDGPVKDFTDNQTLAGKVMAGYQGWFATPNDLDDKGWRHWGRSSTNQMDASQITIDAWPYLNDYNPSDLFSAGKMVHQDGRPAYLFSSRDPEVVQRHFRWMRKHNIDGVYLQRFVTKTGGGSKGEPEFVLDNVRKAAAAEGRIWAIEYDVSSLDNNTTNDLLQFAAMTNDWHYLTNQCQILKDPRYAHHNGMPVLFIWGFGVLGNNASAPDIADPIISWFASQNLYLIGGTSKNQIDNAAWQPVLRKYDQLLEWMERDLSPLVALKTQLNGFGMKILPHAWPGFSWNNLQKTVYPTSYTARGGGTFYWTRIYNAISCGADQVFLGMFDEYDEGTAIMPFSDNHPDTYEGGGTNHWGHYLDNEGRDPFWYLRLSGAAREMLNGQRARSATMPLESALTPVAYGGDDATAYLGATNIVDGLTHTQPTDGLTGGTVLGGHNCRTNAASYFYFNIDDAFCFNNTAGQSATIEVEYFDNTTGTVFRLQYDSLLGPYMTHPTYVTAPGKGGWKNIRWNVTNGLFGNRQNNGSDLRVSVEGGARAAIRRVSVFLPEESGGISSEVTASIALFGSGLEWPVLLDATGWRMKTTSSLTDTNWQEISGPFIFTNGTVRHVDAFTNSAGFYRLEHPAKQ